MRNSLKQRVIELYYFAKKFIKKSKEDSLSAYAAQTTFFILLSFFPLLILLFVLSSEISFLWNKILEYVFDLIPNQFDKYVFYVVEDMMYSRKKTITIITVILALWSSSKMVQALSYGLDKIYGAERKKNYIITRLISSLYTFIFVLLCMAALIFDVFSNRILDVIVSSSRILSNTTLIIISMRTVITFVILFVLIWLIYYQLPARKGNMKKEYPGAMAASAAWIVMTKLFSFYIKYISGQSYMYGGLTSVILLVIWLYFGIQILLYGAHVNYYLNHS